MKNVPEDHHGRILEMSPTFTIPNYKFLYILKLFQINHLFVGLDTNKLFFDLATKTNGLSSG
jgi:hypothetical protein